MDGAVSGTGGIFISYRREDAAYPAGWLYDRLAEHFGEQRVFKDVDSIQLGDDFVEVITRAVAACDVLLALIGKEWLSLVDEAGRPRLAADDDFVRLEIEAALARGVRVIPILVDGAKMPHAKDLPPAMAHLGRRQALELSPSRFASDTNRLLEILESTLAEVRTTNGSPASAPPVESRSPEPPPPVTGPRLRRRLMVIAATVVIVFAIAFGASLLDGRDSASTEPLDVSPESIAVSRLTLTSSHEPPTSGDTVTIAYVLTNVGSAPLSFAEVFAGVRDPADQHRDEALLETPTELPPGAALEVQGVVQLDQPGDWRIWPCYTLQDGQLCPPDWQLRTITVQ